jgi:predicted amidohydrolase
MQKIKAAVVQTRSTEDVDANLKQAEQLVRAAAADGATFIALPENVPFLRIASKENFPEPVEGGRSVEFFGSLARELGVAILLGSFQQTSGEAQKVYNTSVLLGPDGKVAGKYEKIHLFDIDIPGVVSLRESDYIKPGTEPVVAELFGTRFGMTICYDLRFPELYRKLLDKGAEVLLVPAAFTLQTGKDHWEVLLRARAIENQCYLLAPGQWGPHGGQRYSYGHSMIIDPWGHVIAKCSDGEGFATAWLDPDKLVSVRRNLPCREHRRL